MSWFGHGNESEAAAELRKELGELRLTVAEMRAHVDGCLQAMEAARLDYAELAAKAHRDMKRAEAVRRDAERAAEAEQEQRAQLELVPELDRETPLRNTRLARSRVSRAQEA